MLDLFSDQVVEAPPAEDPLAVLSSLATTCTACRLGATVDTENMGIAYDGPVSAKVAFLGDFPEVEGAANLIRQPIAKEIRHELNKWIYGMGLEPEDVFVLNTIQCKTFRGRKKKADKLRLPYPDEVDACFPHRALRILRNMPNLEVVVALGMTAAGALLGRTPEPTPRAFEGQWFGTDKLPGKAILVLNHPREYNRETDRQKAGKIQQFCRYVYTEYTQTGKILTILKDNKEKRDRLFSNA